MVKLRRFLSLTTLLSLLLVIVMTTGCITSSKKTEVAKTKKERAKSDESTKTKQVSSDYEKLLAKTKADMNSVDAAALRTAYIKTDSFDPYNNPEDEKKAMYKDLDFKDIDEIIKKSDAIFENNYLEIETHFIVSSAYELDSQIGKSTKHFDFAVNLLEAVTSTGSGSSKETAFKVISIAEEEAVIKYRGLKSIDKRSEEYEGILYDIVQVIDPITGERSELYFDIDIPYTWLTKKFKD